MPSRIARIELWHVNVPLPAPFWPSWIPGYPQTHVAQTFARFYTDDGLVGETAGPAFTTERHGLGDLLGGFLLGLAADDMVAFRQRLREASYLGWRNWWLEAAYWDLAGKMAGKPVYKLLQEQEETVERVRVYASSGALKPLPERRAYLDEIRRMGFGAVKIRVKYPTLEEDLAIVRGVREAVGEGFVLGVDANQGWPVSLFRPNPDWDLERATAFARGCDELGVAWLEEPLDMHDWRGMAELRRRVATPIAGGELHGGWHELAPLFDHGSLDIYQPDAMFCGLTVSKRVMGECRRRGLGFSPHTWSNGFNVLVNLHAFAAWERRGVLEYPFEPPGFVPAAREGIMPPVEVAADGTIAVPQSPGLGVEIDDRLLRRHGRCFHVSTPTRVALRTIREKGLKAALQVKKAKQQGSAGGDR
ncbi:MAG: mandelate racemase/muconate lactonizing enzyme family protein [Cryobacterium sp.]